MNWHGNSDKEGEAVTQTAELNSRLQRINEQLTLDNDSLRATLACIGDAVIITDGEARISFLNPVAEQLLGWNNSEAAGMALQQILKISTEETGAIPDNPVISCLHTRKITRLPGDTLLIRRDGSEVSIDDTAAPILDASGGVTGAVMIFRDVNDKRELVRNLRHQALHDSLTGLDNRRSLELSLDALLDSPQPRVPSAFLYLDLDQFKVVNDTGGHAAGDRLLREVGRLLQAQARTGDKIARLGGDEFGILLPGCSAEDAKSIAHQIRANIAAFRFEWEDKKFTIDVSVGVVPIPSVGGSLSALFIAADDACYAAKANGGSRIHTFEEDNQASRDRHDEMGWVERINNALQSGQFRLYSQPIVSAAAIRVREEWEEVLLRMQDSDGVVILPGQFIPAAERYGLITSIDRWVFHHSIMALQARQVTHPLLVFSINVSGPSLSDDGFLNYVLEELLRTGVSGSKIRFEITETAAITDVTHAMRFISLLKQLGCQFALDDFGTGLASFSYLKNLLIDYLKIPGRFVENMTRDAMDYAMVEGIHRTARAMGFQTVAEHVDNEATLLALEQLGIDYVQGNLLGRPAPLLAPAGWHEPFPAGYLA